MTDPPAPNPTTNPAKRKRGAGDGYLAQRKGPDGRPLKAQWRGELQVGTKPDGTPDVRYVSGHSRREVQQKLHDLREQQRTGSLGPRDERTFAAHWEWYLRDVAALTVRDTTLTLYRKCGAHLLPTLGALKLRDITPEHIASLYASLTRAGISAGYLHTIARTIGPPLNYAVRAGMIPRNPAYRVAKPTRTKTLRALTADETRRLLAAAHTLEDGWERHGRSINFPRFTPWLELSLASGARVNELLAARWANLDQDKRTLLIDRTLIRTYHPARHSYHEPKSTHSRRVITLPQQTIDTLRAWRRRHAAQRLAIGPDWAGTGDDADLIFCSATGAPAHDRWATHWLKRALAEAGLPTTFRVHDLRHTHATQLLLAGEQLTVVSQRLGHSSATITLSVYAHVLEGMDADAATRIGKTLYGTA